MAQIPTTPGQRAKNILRSFSPQQLLIVSGLALVGVVGVFALLRWVNQPSYVVLTAGLDAKSVSDLAKRLDGAAIGYRLSPDGSAFEVKLADRQRAHVVLSESGLTPDSHRIEGYEILDRQGFSVSEFNQRVDLQRATEGELARMLMGIEGVRSVTVRLAIPPERLFKNEQLPPSASVLLTLAKPLDEAGIRSVRELVAKAVPGLTPDNVSIADSSGQILSASGSGANDDTKTAARLGTSLESKAESMLASMYGDGHALVRVNAELQTDAVEEETTRYDPASKVALREQESAENFTGTGSPPQGVIGVQPADAQAGGNGNSNYVKSDRVSEFGVNRIVTTQKRAGGAVKRLTVAVALDGKLEPAPDPEAVKALVAGAVGFNAARGDTIALSTFTFDEAAAPVSEPVKALVKAGLMDKVMKYAQPAGAALLLAACVWLLRRGLRQQVSKVPADVLESATLALAPATSTAGKDDKPAGAVIELDIRETQGSDGFGADRVAYPGDHQLAGGEFDATTEMLSLIEREQDDVVRLLRGWVADRRS